MSESDLIAEMARAWVDGGGDAEGIDWCWQKIRIAVAHELASRKVAEGGCEE